MDVMQQVTSGMRVVDSDGAEVGEVENFKMGDEEAVTSRGQRVPDNGGILEGLFDAFRERSTVSPQEAERMLRIGYVVIDRKGLFAGNDHIAADRLDRVEDGTLWLKPGAAE